VNAEQIAKLRGKYITPAPAGWHEILDEIERLTAECSTRQQAQIASGHSLQEAYNELAEHLYQRRCWECKHVGYYALDILPFCQCSECGSADTRRLTAADAAGGE